jgi:HEAT repeat protein
MVKPNAWMLALLLGSRSAHALVWPDVAARMERDLASPDTGLRRAAVEGLARLSDRVATPLVLAALRDADDSVKIAAADAAIRLRIGDATQAVTWWLNSSNSRLRTKACEVAGRLPDSRAIQGLARALGDSDAAVRAAAADALGHHQADESVPPLLGRLDDQAPTVRVSAIRALAHLHDGRAALPLSTKVQDSSIEVREAAIRALGTLRDQRAAPVLSLALRDTNVNVQRAALRALGQLRASDAVDAIIPFATDRSPATRIPAIRALGAIGSPSAVRVLVGMLGVGDDAVGALERSPVRDALVDCGTAAIGPVATVLDAPTHASAPVSAAWVLGALGAHDHVGDIVASMRKGLLPVAAALHALVGAGTAADVAVLLEFVSSTNPTIRDQALSAAAALLDPSHPDGRAVEPLAAALLEPSTTSKQQARLASLLGRTGASRAAPHLANLVQARNPELQLAAIDALGMLGPSGADDVLLQVVDSPDPAVRLHAAAALALSGGSHARDVLVDRLDTGDEIDRTSYLVALGGVLSRLPDEHVIARLAAWLPLMAGAERDSMIEAIGRAPTLSAIRVLAALTTSPDPADRRSATAMLAAHRGSDDAQALARGRLADEDPSVSAEGAWAMGTLGTVSDIARLSELAHARATDVAANAVASIGRILAESENRTGATDDSEHVLCERVSDARAEVRANALSGLAHTRVRCDLGAAERSALAGDPDENVRAAAARAVSRFATPADAAALGQCAESDPSWTVGRYCLAPARAPSRTQHVLVYIVPDGARAPQPQAPYCVALADATLRLGSADRRGALFDPNAPQGDVALCRPRW